MNRAATAKVPRHTPITVPRGMTCTPAAEEVDIVDEAAGRLRVGMAGVRGGGTVEAVRIPPVADGSKAKLFAGAACVAMVVAPPVGTMPAGDVWRFAKL